MTTFVKILNGEMAGRKTVRNVTFPMVKPFTASPTTGRTYIKVNGEGIDGYPQRNFQIWLNSEHDYEVTTADGQLDVAQSPATPMESDEEIRDRIGARFDILHEMSRATIDSNIRAMIVTGPPGVGKSYGVHKEMNDREAIETAQNGGVKRVFHDVIKGAITPIGLYKKLFEYRAEGSVLIFDDCDNMLQDEVSLNLLKAALDSNKVRKICWHAQSYALEEAGIPNHFNFRGAVIFITNIDFNDIRSKKMIAHLEALQSRCHFLDLAINGAKEKLIWIKHVIENSNMFEDYEFSQDTINEIVQFMDDHRNTLNELSLRMALKIADLVKVSDVMWKQMAEVTCTGRVGKYSGGN